MSSTSSSSEDVDVDSAEEGTAVGSASTLTVVPYAHEPPPQDRSIPRLARAAVRGYAEREGNDW